MAESETGTERVSETESDPRVQRVLRALEQDDFVKPHVIWFPEERASYESLAPAEQQRAFAVTAWQRVVDEKVRPRGRRVLVCQGTPFQQGALHRLALGSEIDRSTALWMPYLLPTVLSQSFHEKVARSGLLANLLFHTAVWSIVAFLSERIETHYRTVLRAGTSPAIPDAWDEELRGLLYPDTPETRPGEWRRLLVLNLGFDWLLTMIVGGTFCDALNQAQLWPRLLGKCREARQYARDPQLRRHPRVYGTDLAHFTPEDFQTPPLCDAAAFTSRSNGQAYLVRDFFFPNGRYFPELDTTVVRLPAQAQAPLLASRQVHATACVCLPGMIGALTACNDVGLALGVHLVADPEACGRWAGTSGLLSVRGMAEHCGDVPSALQWLRRSPRGAAYLYPVNDTQGRAGVLEALSSRPLTPAEHLTSASAPPAWSSVSKDGQFFERPDQLWREAYDQESERVRFRSHDFKLSAPEAVAASRKRWGAQVDLPRGLATAETTGYVFETYQAETQARRAPDFHDRFFHPTLTQSRGLAGAAVCSNFFLVPAFKARQAADELSLNLNAILLRATSWRYCHMVRALEATRLELDDRSARQHVAHAFSPERAPGLHELGQQHAFAPSPEEKVSASLSTAPLATPPSPSSGFIQGCFTVVNCHTQTLYTQSGQWSSPWYRVTLRQYCSRNRDAEGRTGRQTKPL